MLDYSVTNIAAHWKEKKKKKVQGMDLDVMGWNQNGVEKEGGGREETSERQFGVHLVILEWV